MKAIVCDKCGKICKPHDIVLVRVNSMVDITNFRSTNLSDFDICDNCYKEMFGDLLDKEKK